MLGLRNQNWLSSGTTLAKTGRTCGKYQVTPEDHVGEVAALLAFAAGDDEQQKDGRKDKADDREREERMKKHAERIEIFRLWKIMEYLDLSEDQVDEFFPMMRQHGKQERKIAEERGTLIRELQEALRQDIPSKANLRKLIDAVKQNKRRLAEEKEALLEKSAKILSIEQQARMLLGIDKVERKLWESIARVRHHRPGHDIGEPFPDKDKLRGNMEELRKKMERINKELKEKGLPGLDMDDFSPPEAGPES